MSCFRDFIGHFFGDVAGHHAVQLIVSVDMGALVGFVRLLLFSPLYWRTISTGKRYGKAARAGGGGRFTLVWIS